MNTEIVWSLLKSNNDFWTEAKTKNRDIMDKQIATCLFLRKLWYALFIFIAAGILWFS